ncbi:MAG: 3'-5' exonuclease [Peptoniphilaceae bacterium]|nr:UvrD-helicase domain-containing protein [Peptoniphilaceae bacterium]MDD7383863.1 3'-5' exonuclease [Peptoniphilaceae bacterium]MDY3738004.1 3'-5' exonuclease [Peptoniphilaceae bacterium]
MDLSNLNDKQKEAVLNTGGALLVLAGAGSGKTRVLTTKIAYVIEEENILKNNIVAITFTNKAANEMKERISSLLNEDISDLWIGTFHSVCARILRYDIDKIGYDRNFTIYDTADQKSLIKEIIKDNNFDDDLNPSMLISLISKLKNADISPEKFLKIDTFYVNQEVIYEVYKEYEKRKFEYNALDFDDLILKVLELFEKSKKTLDYYQKKFEYVFVDEYQDTNKSQYELIKYFSGFHKNICVVGDNDQSIYSFRGADVSNILNFERDFKGADVIKLEQNYRSNQKILNVANSLIKNNTQRKDKKLWSDKKSGDDVIYVRASNENEEAYFVVNKIKDLINEKYSLNDIAILYRTNSQSRTFEEGLMRNDINYKVVGGLKFYDRKEIKDIISYLQIIVNRKDDISLKRIINVPKRGIGNKTIENLENYARNIGFSMIEVIENKNLRLGLNDRTNSLLDKFFNPLKDIFLNFENYTIVELINEILDKSGYLSSLKTSYSVEDRSRIENINEFISSADDYEKENPENTIYDYLENLSLLSDLDKTEETENSVSLMTVHSSKGLEFKICFDVGLDEGLFPSKRSVDEGNLEEERRLFYVAITRAKEKLFITSSETRRIYGNVMVYKQSRFIDEIRDKIVEKPLAIHKKTFVNNSFNFENVKHAIEKEKIRESILNKKKKINIEKSKEKSFSVGDKIKHKKRGIGMVVMIKDTEDGKELTISFEKKGIKKLNQNYAPIEKAL